jgi:hypothetical protein
MVFAFIDREAIDVAMNDRLRRISPVAAHSGDRLLSELKPALSLVGGNRSSCP